MEEKAPAGSQRVVRILLKGVNMGLRNSLEILKIAKDPTREIYPPWKWEWWNTNLEKAG